MRNDNNIIIIGFGKKQLRFDLNNPRDRELLETLKAVGAGTHTSVIIESTTTDVRHVLNNDISSHSE